ncbi:TMEM175 family protein [Liquorilactobacillus mali]|uniref:TMEM175 family protein n=1 Tax=Liquorilactobacillus mali TaxID=1618 RepID=UPI00264F010E|nr:TMEM175 family protein [Liquorilactobacillus mali]MDN7146509.1 TMEM175 family protein [Liquorilactobacillus mali]
MNKGRVEAYTDAVVAIILTIMVLEFKTPETAQWEEITKQLPYFFAYIVSFVFIGVAWYNHHYMFTLANRITKKVYWVNNLWLFSMSLLPVATGWVGKFPQYTSPEYFYLLIFTFWSVTYRWLSDTIRKTADHRNTTVSQKIEQMLPFRFLNSLFFPLSVVVIAVGIYFYPLLGITITLIELIILGLLTSPDSDKIKKTY